MFYPLRCPEKVEFILNQPHILKHSGDDFLRPLVTPGCGKLLLNSPVIDVIGVQLGGFCVGMYILQRKGECSSEVHTCFLKAAFGKTDEICMKFREYVFATFPWLLTLTTMVSSQNRLALKMTRNVGFEHCGTFNNYWKDGDKLLDMHFFQMFRNSTEV
jgi:hypothetical protein